MQTKILVAVKPKVEQVVAKALTGYQLLFAATLESAKMLIADNQVDLFVIGILWDSSGALELVWFIRSIEVLRSAPILMVRLMPSEYEELLRQSVSTIQTIAGLAGYLEISHTDPAACSVIRATVERCLPEEKRMRPVEGNQA